MKRNESDLCKKSENVDDKFVTTNKETKKIYELDIIKRKDDLEQMENKLAAKLRNLCDEKGEEKELQKSAEILYKLGKIYFEKSTTSGDEDDNRRLMMVSLIRSACLFNAAITRKPNSVQAIKNDLKTLCSQVLNKSGAFDKNANLIAQSELVKQDIEKMRDMVRHRLCDIQLLDEKEIRKNQKEINKILAIKNLQEEITISYTNIIADIMHFCQTVMGEPPCKFALVGMGSLARKEITPYSDFEHIIVLEENSNKRSDYSDILNYFRWLSVIFQIVVINLQETIIPCVNIPSLIDQHNKQWFFDRITTNGICFDSMMPHACKFPLGKMETTENNQSLTELIKPVDEMLKYLSVDQDLKNGYHLKDILTKVCYVGGDKFIFDNFKTKVYDILKKENRDERTNSIKKLLIEDLDNFATRSKVLDLTSTSPFNLKKDFYRSSTLFISALGQLHNIEASSCFDISEKLEERKLISPKVKHYQMYAVALACELRLKWYMDQKQQEDFMKSKDGSNDSIQVLLEKMKASSVMKYFQIVYALQCDISKTVGLKKIHFYSYPKLINLKMYHCFKMLYKFENFIKKFNRTDIDKTARLYSTEEIMNQLEDESKQNQELEENQLFEIDPNEVNIKEMVFELGQWFRTQESYDEALELFQMYFDITKINDHKKTNNNQNVLDNISECLVRMQKPGEAITYLQRSMKNQENASLDINTDVGFAITLNNIGRCLIDMQKPKEAITYLQRSMRIHENALRDINTDLSFAITLGNIAESLMKMQKPGEAIIYLRKSMAIKENASFDINTDVSFAKTLNGIGRCLMEMLKPGEAIAYLQRSMTIKKNASRDINTDVSFAATVGNIGSCLVTMENYNEAITYLQRSKAIVENISLDIYTDVDFALALNNIGNCLTDMQKPDEAIAYLQRSMTIVENASLDINTDVNFATTLFNIGRCLMDMQKPGEAIAYFRRSMKIQENVSLDSNTDVYFAATLRKIGRCLLCIQKPGEAIIYLQRSITIFDTASLDTRLVATLNNIGRQLTSTNLTKSDIPMDAVIVILLNSFLLD